MLEGRAPAWWNGFWTRNLGARVWRASRRGDEPGRVGSTLARAGRCRTWWAGVLTVDFSRLRRYLLPPMFTARTKIVKDRADQEPTELEDDVAKALFELQEQVGAPN